MATRNPEVRLERFNLVISLEESEWLNQLSAEIKAQTGAKVSRSEITRASLRMMRELHEAAPLRPDRFLPLEVCKNANELSMQGVLAVRWATPIQPVPVQTEAQSVYGE